MSTIRTDIIEKARALIQMTENATPDVVTSMLTPWVREDVDTFVQVMLALTAMADKDKFAKQGHAAYVRGERSAGVVDMERQYQRERKAGNRPYLKRRSLAADADGATTEGEAA